MPETKKYNVTEEASPILEDGQINIYGEEDPDVLKKAFGILQY